MKNFPTPIVVVSKCLGFAECRYNGQVLNDPFIDQLRKFVSFITICPEMEIGLGVPRDPVRMVNLKTKRILFQPATGNDVTKDMIEFSKRFLDSLDDVDGFILKSRSPSCGLKDVKVYSGLDKGAATSKDSGFFGKDVLDRFGGFAIEDEGRLSNFFISK